MTSRDFGNARNLPRAGTGGQDDMRSVQYGLGLTIRALQLQIAATHQPAKPVIHRDLVLLHQMRDAGGQLLGDRARALHDLVQIEFDVIRRKTELAHIVEKMVDFRGA
jgi:hypothetical protein